MQLKFNYTNFVCVVGYVNTNFIKVRNTIEIKFNPPILFNNTKYTIQLQILGIYLN